MPDAPAPPAGADPAEVHESREPRALAALRPVERRVIRLAAAGIDDAEIGRRFNRSPGWATNVRRLAALDRAAGTPRVDRLRPIERCVVRWRDRGTHPDELSARFHRSAPFLSRIEGYARYKLTDMSTPG